MSSSLARRLLLALVLGLYATLSFSRQWTSWLRGEGLLAPAVILAFAAALLFVGWLVRGRAGQAPIPLPALVLAISSAVVLLVSWEHVEERIHLAVYAVVGALAWSASSYRLWPALVLGVAIGAGEEALQLFISSRVFDLRDLIANVGVVSAFVLLTSGGRRSWFSCGLLGGVWLALLQLPIPTSSPSPVEEFPVVSAPDRAPPPPLSRPAQRSMPTSPASVPEGSTGEAVYSGSSVVLITIDALRADHLAPWGDPPVDLPTFSRLQQSSLSFEEVFANGAWTSPGMVSFLTGLHPSVHGVEERGVNFPPAAVTVLDTLSEAGYATWGFAVDGEENYSGLGFQYGMDRALPPEKMLLSALRAQAGPAFAWLHLRDIHAPYDATHAELEALGLPTDLPSSPILDRARTHHTVPRAEFPGRHGWLQRPIRALYAAELARQDRILGAVLSELAAVDNLIVIVSADHGEELLDHDGIGHASTTLHSPPHPELVRIPLYIQLPDGRGAGEQRSGAFQQVDLMPTLGGLLGVEFEQPVPGLDLDGRDLSAVVLGEEGARAESTSERPVLVSTSPCGWQCPPDRRHERIHALIEGHSWSFCDQSAGPCEEPIATQLRSLRERAELLRSQGAEVE